MFNITLICTYGPIDDGLTGDTDGLSVQLESILAAVPRGNVNLFTGDLNTKIGNE